jgi:hypothetical protein
MGRLPHQYFSQNEYLLGDSAFQMGPHLVPAFKTANGVTMNRNEASFNKLLLSPRVKSEHCIGILKGRFAWLKDIRILIANADDAQKIVEFVGAAVILHNLLIGAPIEDEWLEDEEFLELGNDDALNQELDANDTPNGDNRRQQLMGYFAEEGIEEGIGGVI